MLFKKEVSPIGKAINDALKEMSIYGKIQELLIEDAWIELGGGYLKRYTSGLYYRQGVLYVTLTSAPLRQELRLSKNSLIQQINNKLGEEILIDIVLK